MRIIAGKHKGRRIEFGKDLSAEIRPTSEFAREAVFNILSHGKLGLSGQGFTDMRVLDIFCGTGAFGLEALSRGAESVTFIDHSRDAIGIARHNATRMQETTNTEFITTDASRLGRARKSYSLVFLDPPYFSKLIGPTLKSLAGGGWLDEDALIIAECDAKEALELPPGFESIDDRKYGRAGIHIIKAIAAS